MHLLTMLLALALLVGCGTIEYGVDEPESPPPEPRAETTTTPAPQPTAQSTQQATEAQAPEPTRPAGACSADASHCCMPDGRVVRPGGCMPSYPPNVQPATERAPDGACRQIACFVRCLPGSASIATPGGPVPIAALQTGDLVYTRGPEGERVVAPILRVVSLEVSTAHSLVEISLEDGRRVRGSRGHPLAEGGTIGALQTGDMVDGSRVVGARRVEYEGTATWDLLPAGESGSYWADGVLLGSTIPP